jgi:flagellar hook-associated protein 1 FlgK
MSLSQSLNNALSGLTAASRLAEVVSANLANALTEGYGRRQVALSADSAAGRGGGVRVDGLLRQVDRVVLGERRLADAVLARTDLGLSMAKRVESIVGPAAGEDTLAARLNRLESALIGAAGDPSSDTRLGQLLARLTEVARGLNAAAAGVQDLRLSAERRIAADVEVLNTSLARVEALNRDISRSLAAGGDAAALMDERQKVIDRIAGIVPVRELDRPRGAVALVTTGGQMLIDGTARRIGFEARHTITADMTHGNGLLAGLTLDGDPLDPADPVGPLGGGSLGAAFAQRDGALVAAQAGLDALAADLLRRFGAAGVDPTLPPGAAGLFTDAGGPLDPADTIGLAGRIAVNAAVDPGQGGALWRLRDGLGAVAPGPVGAADQIDRWLAALGAAEPLGTGGPVGSAARHAADLMSRLTADRLESETERGFAASRQATLREAELAGGVDSDQELQMLLRIEQAYAANARVMQVLQDMIDRLMEI